MATALTSKHPQVKVLRRATTEAAALLTGAAVTQEVWPCLAMIGGN